MLSTLLEAGGFVGLVVFAALAWGLFAACAVGFGVVMILGHLIGDA